MSNKLFRGIITSCLAVMLGILWIPNANAQVVPGIAGDMFEVDGDLDSQGLTDWHDLIGADDSILGDPTKIFHVVDLTGNADLSVFAKSDKVFHDPNTYDWKTGSVPQKDDMENCNFYLFQDGAGDLWAAMSGDRRATNGNSYIDFEFLQNTLMKNPDGSFTSYGPDGGRTIGDMLVTILLTRGGTQPEFFLQEWLPDGNGGFNYFDVVPPAGTAFVASNAIAPEGPDEVPVDYDAFGSNIYEVNAFGEASINVSQLIFGSDHCKTISTMFIRTKSSSSPTAQLKDMCEPIQLNICLDEEDPVIDIPADFEVLCENFSLSDLLVFDYGTATATDNCDLDIEITSTPVFFPTCGDSGYIEITWMATDDCGNVDTAVQRVDVVDNTAPVIVCEADKNVECGTPVIWGTPGVSDNCSPVEAILLELIEDSSLEVGCTTVLTRTWRATDECGNTSECSQTITIVDTTPPLVLPLDDVAVECAADIPPVDIGLIDAIDDCNGIDLLIEWKGDTPLGDGCGASVDRVYRVTDACDNFTEVTQTITVDDTIAPEITPLDEITVQCITDIPEPDTSLVLATDNCDLTLDVLFISDSALTDACGGFIERVYRVTDDCDNSTDVTQIITVDDTIAPEITPLGDITVECIADIPAPDTSIVSATDNCDLTLDVLFISDSALTDACGGFIERVYRVTDDCDNSADVTQIITVDDTIAPEITPLGDITVECIADIPAPDTSIVSATDNCDLTLDVLFISDSALTDACGGFIERVYRVTDDCDNSTDVTQIIIVDDTIAPEVTPLGDITVECIADIPLPDTSIVSATDNCDLNLDVLFISDSALTDACGGFIERVYRVTDDCDNSTDVTQIITVDDTIAPEITPLGDITVQCIADIPAPDTSIVSATDNCDLNLDVLFISDSALTDACGGFIERVYRVTDDCDNSTDVTQIITVDDTIAPEITPLGEITVQCIADIPAPNTALVSATDNCDLNLDVSFISDSALTDACGGFIERVYRVTDDCENSTDVTQIITVHDTIAPEITPLDEITVQCVADIPAPDTSIVSASDNCDLNLDVSFISDSVLTDACGGFIERVYRVTDDCENSTDVTQIITVNDTIAPEITPLDDINVQCITDVPEPDTSIVSATDNCDLSLDVAFVSDTPETIGCVTYIERVYSVTDDCDNSSNVSQYIIVEDTTAPVIAVPADDVLECNVPTDFAILASDNCGVEPEIVLNFIGDASTYDLQITGNGTFTISLLDTANVTVEATAIDDCGNASETLSYSLSSVCSDICETGKPVTLAMRYEQGGCAATQHSQEDGFVTCEDHNGGVQPEDVSVYIVAGSKDKESHKQYRELFAGTVALDQMFLIDGTKTRRGDLVGNTTIFIYTDDTKSVLLEQVTFHTSCSQPLIPGDHYGSSKLIVATTDESAL